MPSRRRFLAASAAVGTTVLAGCSALPFGGGGDSGSGEPSAEPNPEPSDDTPRELHVESGWPNARRDPAHTGLVPDASLADPGVKWRSDPVPFNAKPTVSGATVVVGAKGLRGIDVLSGDELWSSRYGTGAWAPPVVDDTAYATTQTLEGDDQSGLVAVDAVDGERDRTPRHRGGAADAVLRRQPRRVFSPRRGRRPGSILERRRGRHGGRPQLAPGRVRDARRAAGVRVRAARRHRRRARCTHSGSTATRTGAATSTTS